MLEVVYRLVYLDLKNLQSYKCDLRKEYFILGVQCFQTILCIVLNALNSITSNFLIWITVQKYDAHKL
jgi:hypothetical protein